MTKLFLVLFISFTSLFAFAGDLDSETARVCTEFAKKSALDIVSADWGDGVSVMNLWVVSTGNLIGRRGVVESYISASVVVSRESTDPAVVELAVTGTRATDGSVKCTLSTSKVHDIVQ